MNKFKLIIIAMVALNLIGCANVGIKFDKNELEQTSFRYAIVFFYRPSKFQGGGATIPVIANNNNLGKLDNGAYFKSILTPGPYKIHSRTTNVIDRVSNFSFEAGKRYFIKASFEKLFTTRLVLVNEDDAVQEIKETSKQL